MPHSPAIATIEEIILEAKAGRMFILVDDEQRENEGDLVIPAQFANAKAVNFMATHGRGLICLTLERKRVEQLNLNLMAQQNLSRHRTAFTVSIEAREGVTTGISAADRAHTIATAIDPAKQAHDLVSPGHVFPLVARDGGVLIRAGHTEAAVDISKLAGLNPSGVICEIMNEDGTMSRLPDLIPFAEKHGLKIATIADLIAYRRRSEKLIERIAETLIESRYGGEFKLIVYRSHLEYAEHIALVKGAPDTQKSVYVRMHALNLLSDVLGEGAGDTLHAAMQQIAAHGSGVIVLLREPLPTSLSDRIKARSGHAREKNMDLRHYGIGAQILLDLGVRHMTLLSNNKRAVVGLEGYGLTIDDYTDIAPL